MGAPTGVTQAVGAYLVFDGSYGLVSNGRDLAAAFGFGSGMPDELNSPARAMATIWAPGGKNAQLAADVFSVGGGIVGGKMVNQPLMFSSARITSDSSWPPLLRTVGDMYTGVQVIDAAHSGYSR